jgi:hypothetical protein
VGFLSSRDGKCIPELEVFRVGDGIREMQAAMLPVASAAAETVRAFEEISILKQLGLVFANVSRPQAVRRTVEASREIFDCADVRDAWIPVDKLSLLVVSR